MLILIKLNILPMALDLMHMEVFCYQVVVGFVKILKYLVVIWVHWYILIIKKVLLKCPTDGLDDTLLTTEREYSMNFANFVFCNLMGWIVMCLLMVLKYANSK